MEVPQWFRWLILILIMLCLICVIYSITQVFITRQKRRARLHINLLETKEQMLLDRIADLERQLAALRNTSIPAQEDEMIYGKKVFISYSSKDYAIANAVRELLKQHKIPSFMAPESIPAGSNYTQEIPEAIGACFAMVVLLSQSAQESKWVPKEIDMALEDNVPVIPFLVDINKPNRQFRFMLGQCQYIHPREDANNANQELIARLKHLQAAARSVTQ